VSEYDMTYRGPVDGPGGGIEDRTAVTIGVGDRAVTGAAVEVSAEPDVALTDAIVARFRDADTSGTAADFSAKINWGDGTALSTGTVARESGSPSLNVYAVTGSHTYAEPGRYPIVVELTGAKGAKTEIRSSALVSAEALKIRGERIEGRLTKLTDRVLATFTDANSTGDIAAYAATIDWGDGRVRAAKIRAEASGFSCSARTFMLTRIHSPCVWMCKSRHEASGRPPGPRYVSEPASRAFSRHSAERIWSARGRMGRRAPCPDQEGTRKRDSEAALSS
jgi:hypothetical protein